mgnify:CR=1 FL=1
MKIFSFALPLAVGGLAAWHETTDDGVLLAAVCPAGMDIPHCVDDSLCAHGLGESARAAVRLAGA